MTFQARLAKGPQALHNGPAGKQHMGDYRGSGFRVQGLHCAGLSFLTSDLTDPLLKPAALKLQEL